MKMEDILSNLSEEINKELFHKFLDEFREMKEAYYVQNYELVLTKAGKLVELTFQILSDLAFEEISKQPNINQLIRRLESDERAKKLNDSLRLIIPRVAYALYTLRSKRGAVHVNHEVSPNFIDSTLAVSMCSWILSEFLRLFLKFAERDVLNLINTISKINNIPLIEEIDGYSVILKPEMTAENQILIILYFKHPEAVSRRDLNTWVKKSRARISSAIKVLLSQSSIVEVDKGIYKLTTKGLAKAEEIILKYHRSELIENGGIS